MSFPVAESINDLGEVARLDDLVASGQAGTKFCLIISWPGREKVTDFFMS